MEQNGYKINISKVGKIEWSYIFFFCVKTWCAKQIHDFSHFLVQRTQISVNNRIKSCPWEGKSWFLKRIRMSQT